MGFRSGLQHELWTFMIDLYQALLVTLYGVQNEESLTLECLVHSCWCLKILIMRSKNLLQFRIQKWQAFWLHPPKDSSMLIAIAIPWIVLISKPSVSWTSTVSLFNLAHQKNLTTNCYNILSTETGEFLDLISIWLSTLRFCQLMFRVLEMFHS